MRLDSLRLRVPRSVRVIVAGSIVVVVVVVGSLDGTSADIPDPFDVMQATGRVVQVKHTVTGSTAAEPHFLEREQVGDLVVNGST